MRTASKKLSFAQKSCLSKAGKLMYQTSMLRPGARLGVAVSGGMDSWALLQVLLLYRKKLPFRIELLILHINPGFCRSNHQPLLDWLRSSGLAGHVQLGDMGPRAHSTENKKNSPCFFCSWHRRKRLFYLVKKYALTHLALGHNADDLVQNFFLNIFYAGRIEGMYPRESYFQGEFELIRPLLLLEKRVIKKAVQDWKLPVWDNPCPFAEKSKRSETELWLQQIWRQDKRLRKNVFSALQRWQMQNPMP